LNALDLLLFLLFKGLLFPHFVTLLEERTMRVEIQSFVPFGGFGLLFEGVVKVKSLLQIG
jgi:hypothetical protein